MFGPVCDSDLERSAGQQFGFRLSQSLLNGDSIRRGGPLGDFHPIHCLPIGDGSIILSNPSLIFDRWTSLWKVAVADAIRHVQYTFASRRRGPEP